MSWHGLAEHHLGLLGRIERRVGLGRSLRRSRFRLGTDYARSERLTSSPSSLPMPLEELPDDAPRVRARCRADLVVLGQFHDGAAPRMRAFYLDGDERTIKLQPIVDGGPDFAHELEARRTVARLVPHLAPPVLGSGIDERGGVGYLAEGLIRGRHARRRDLDRFVPRIVPALTELYRAAGVRTTTVPAHLHADVVGRWERFVAAYDDAGPLADRVRDLFVGEGLLLTSLCHGDPVASNVILREDGGVVFVDWEFARELPIAVDLGKPLVQAPDTRATLACIEEAVAGLPRPVRESGSVLPIREQLALMQAEMLTFFEHRAERAAAAGRLHRYEDDRRKRLALLEWLLG